MLIFTSALLERDIEIIGPEAAELVVKSSVEHTDRFQHGHRIRVQVSSGAFPRFARNLGTGEPLATGTTMHAVKQTVYHDPTHPSQWFCQCRVEMVTASGERV